MKCSASSPGTSNSLINTSGSVMILSDLFCQSPDGGSLPGRWRRHCERAQLRPYELHDLGWSFRRRTCVEGGLGVVFDGELDTLGELRAVHAAEQGEGHVDARRHARGGDHLSAFHHPLLGVVRAPPFQLLCPCPVRGGILPFEDTGGSQLNGPG